MHGTVRFFPDFREPNKTVKNVQHLLLKLEGFRYAISLDLTMGYYHITLCTILLL